MKRLLIALAMIMTSLLFVQNTYAVFEAVNGDYFVPDGLEIDFGTTGYDNKKWLTMNDGNHYFDLDGATVMSNGLLPLGFEIVMTSTNQKYRYIRIGYADAFQEYDILNKTLTLEIYYQSSPLDRYEIIIQYNDGATIRLQYVYQDDFYLFMRDEFSYSYAQGLNDAPEIADSVRIGIIGFVPSILGSIGGFFLTLGAIEFLGVSLNAIVIVMFFLIGVLALLKLIFGGGD